MKKVICQKLNHLHCQYQVTFLMSSLASIRKDNCPARFFQNKKRRITSSILLSSPQLSCRKLLTPLINVLIFLPLGASSGSLGELGVTSGFSTGSSSGSLVELGATLGSLVELGATSGSLVELGATSGSLVELGATSGFFKTGSPLEARELLKVLVGGPAFAPEEDDLKTLLGVGVGSASLTASTASASLSSKN